MNFNYVIRTDDINRPVRTRANDYLLNINTLLKQFKYIDRKRSPQKTLDMCHTEHVNLINRNNAKDVHICVR